LQEDGWVVCRVFKKKNYQRGLNPAEMAALDDDELQPFPVPVPGALPTDHKHYPHLMQYDQFPSFDPTMQLPQLMSADQPVQTLLPSQPGVPIAMSSLDVECSQNLMKLTSNGSDGMPHSAGGGVDRFTGTTDWSILDKLLASHQNLDQLFQGKVSTAYAPSMAPYHEQLMELGGSSSLHRLPLQYLGGEPSDLLRFPK